MFKPMSGMHKPVQKRKGPMPPGPALDIVVGVGQPKPGKPGAKDEEPVEGLKGKPVEEEPFKKEEPDLFKEEPVEEPAEEAGESIEDLGEKYGMRPEDAEGFVADLFDLIRRKLVPVEKPLEDDEILQ